MHIERIFPSKDILKVDLKSGHLTVKVNPNRTTVLVSVDLECGEDVRADISGCSYANQNEIGLRIVDYQDSIPDKEEPQTFLGALADIFVSRKKESTRVVVSNVCVRGDITVRDGNVSINGMCFNNQSRYAVRDIRMTIETPSFRSLRADCSNTEIHVEGDGKQEIDLKSSNGNVEVKNGGTPFRVKTSNANVRASVSGLDDVDVKTSNGFVDVSLSPDWRGEIKCKTSNGTIDQQHPSSEFAFKTATIKTSNGNIRVV